MKKNIDIPLHQTGALGTILETFRKNPEFAMRNDFIALAEPNVSAWGCRDMAGAVMAFGPASNRKAVAWGILLEDGDERFAFCVSSAEWFELMTANESQWKHAGISRIQDIFTVIPTTVMDQIAMILKLVIQSTSISDLEAPDYASIWREEDE